MSRRRNYSLHNSTLATRVVTAPKPALAVVDAISLILGTVIGAGIFETPALVAANMNSQAAVLLAWLAGGGMSLVGALCYTELATTYPHAGGNYHYLMRAFGKDTAFLFAWARMTVIQTGSIALLAFVLGDYASQLFQIGDYSPSIYAAIVIASLTGLNIVGLQQGKWVQNWLTAATVIGLLLIVIVGLAFTSASTSVVPAETQTQGVFGLVMVFVLLTYGGWDEAAYISAELHNVNRNMEEWH